MIVTPIHTRIFLEWESLIDFIDAYIPTLEDGDILVVTSKIVALAESRTFTPRDDAEKLEYIKRAGIYIRKTKYVHLSLVWGLPIANAGIDESNADGKCILLPEDSYETAYILWRELRARYSIENLGIIITDSRTMPLRVGTTGVSLGHMGFHWLRDYREEKDLFGRPFHFSRTNIPDALATAAVHLMWEWDECQPLAVIKDPHVTYTDERQNGEDLIIEPEDDMYGSLFGF
jgi:dihydrofolate synthase / folylpolyglutamate synthase